MASGTRRVACGKINAPLGEGVDEDNRMQQSRVSMHFPRKDLARMACFDSFWTFQIPSFPSYSTTNSKPHFCTISIFCTHFLQLTAQYTFYTFWLIDVVFFCFWHLKRWFTMLTNDGSYLKHHSYLRRKDTWNMSKPRVITGWLFRRCKITIGIMSSHYKITIVVLSSHYRIKSHCCRIKSHC